MMVLCLCFLFFGLCRLPCYSLSLFVFFFVIITLPEHCNSHAQIDDHDHDRADQDQLGPPGRRAQRDFRIVNLSRTGIGVVFGGSSYCAV